MKSSPDPNGVKKRRYDVIFNEINEGVDDALVGWKPESALEGLLREMAKNKSKIAKLDCADFPSLKALCRNLASECNYSFS